MNLDITSLSCNALTADGGSYLENRKYIPADWLAATDVRLATE